VSREDVLRLLEKPGSPVKLWEPESAGLGKIWAAQGWVLWRWFQLSSAPPAYDVDIRWLDVPIEGQGGSFSLAATIAKAPIAAAGETT
jgi:hypothetical protein